MGRYFFDLRLVDTIADDEGTELPNAASAKSHSRQVARELTRNSEEYLGHHWSCWTMLIRDESGRHIHSLPVLTLGTPTEDA